MNFWTFYAEHPWLGTVSLLILFLIVDSIGVDVVRVTMVLRHGSGADTLSVTKAIGTEKKNEVR